MSELPLNPTQSVIKRNPLLYPPADVPRGTTDALKILDRIDKEYAVRDQLNKTERRYYEWLKRHQQDLGDSWIGVQCVTFKLATACRFTPDFVCWNVNGPRIVDVKARWKGQEKPHVEDDALVKIKMAARLFPWGRFYLAWEMYGDWQHKLIEP